MKRFLLIFALAIFAISCSSTKQMPDYTDRPFYSTFYDNNNIVYRHSNVMEWLYQNSEKESRVKVSMGRISRTPNRWMEMTFANKNITPDKNFSFMVIKCDRKETKIVKDENWAISNHVIKFRLHNYDPKRLFKCRKNFSVNLEGLSFSVDDKNFNNLAFIFSLQKMYILVSEERDTWL